MKKILFAFVAGSISILAVTIGAIAQTSNKVKVFESPGNVVISDKLKVFANKATGFDDINAKALSNFKKTYKDVTDVKWRKNDNGITADFASNGINTTVYYNIKGHWQASMKSYKEEKFESEVRDIVKSTYNNYKIFSVRELETINSYGVPTYLVYIEDGTNFKIIRIRDSQMDTFQQFRKQN